ncbi:DUF4350 domain-containing protein [Streptomyces sp. NPDC090046]|uniref:DUF4350 domain-containing protein n=1 Tax=Streptomyces sp. NPDC090046 TaxID=3365928 RepID=UPI00380209C9
MTAPHGPAPTGRAAGTTRPQEPDAPGPDRDPTTPATTTPATPNTSTALGATAIWRRARGLLLALGMLIATGVALAAFNSGENLGALDPRSADRSGSRAVAELLKERGVTTRVVTRTQEAVDAAGPDTTLLVANPELLSPGQLSELKAAIDLSGGRTVLVTPGRTTLTALAPGVQARRAAPGEVREPACALPAARSAGSAETGGRTGYRTDDPKATACYPDGDHATVLLLPAHAGGDTVLLGSGRILENEHLAAQGNASLALHTLGSRPQLVWYLPSPAEAIESGGAEGEDKSLFELIPAGWSWAVLQLFVAAVLAALWRARRLGPLVTEKLPVAIRASEATEGRARLYRKADARDRAATVLRAATRERLAALVGVPHTRAHDPASLAPAVSARLTGEPRDVTALLFGSTPSDDAALVALADHLDALEREVRTS